MCTAKSCKYSPPFVTMFLLYYFVGFGVFLGINKGWVDAVVEGVAWPVTAGVHLGKYFSEHPLP
jgi:hypothetical protein